MKLFTLHDSVVIDAPIERCFLLSTSVAIVQKELGMKPVAGRTAGLVQDGDTIRWEGWQLGLRHYHVSLIREFRPPHFFQDHMLAGRFRSFEHDHSFEQTASGVLLRDELRFSMPFGLPGKAAGRLILVPHIRRLMHKRFALLKRIAEGEAWRQYLEG